MTDRIGTNRQKGTSLIDLLSVLAIILILVAILLSYSTNDSSGVFPASSVLRDAFSCTPTSKSACSPNQVLPGGMNSGYAFVQLTDGGAIWVRHSIKGSPVTAGMIDRHMSCSRMSGLTRYSNTAAGCTSASITPK